MDGTAASFAVIAGYVVVLALLLGWVMFVARRRHWSLGDRVLVGVLGVVVIVIFAGFISNTLVAIVAPESLTNLSPAPESERIGTPSPS